MLKTLLLELIVLIGNTLISIGEYISQNFLALMITIGLVVGFVRLGSLEGALIGATIGFIMGTLFGGEKK